MMFLLFFGIKWYYKKNKFLSTEIQNFTLHFTGYVHHFYDKKEQVIKKQFQALVM